MFLIVRNRRRLPTHKEVEISSDFQAIPCIFDYARLHPSFEEDGTETYIKRMDTGEKLFSLIETEEINYRFPLSEFIDDLEYNGNPSPILIVEFYSNSYRGYALLNLDIETPVPLELCLDIGVEGYATPFEDNQIEMKEIFDHPAQLDPDGSGEYLPPYNDVYTSRKYQFVLPAVVFPETKPPLIDSSVLSPVLYVDLNFEGSLFIFIEDKKYHFNTEFYTADIVCARIQRDFPALRVLVENYGAKLFFILLPEATEIIAIQMITAFSNEFFESYQYLEADEDEVFGLTAELQTVYKQEEDESWTEVILDNQSIWRTTSKLKTALSFTLCPMSQDLHDTYFEYY